MDNNLTAFGEFLLRLHCSDDKRILQAAGFTPYYAGAEANLCVLLSRLGIPTRYITRVPDNDLAVAGITQLRGHGVGTEHVLYGGNKLGLYFSETGNHIRSTRVVYDRAGSAFSELQPGMLNWNRVLDGQQYFHWTGVAAAVSATAAAVCKEAVLAAASNGLFISADFNYRSTLWQYGTQPHEVMPELLQHAHIAVADLDAAAVYFGIETEKHLPWNERFELTCSELKKHMPKVRTLAMSFLLFEGSTTTYTGAIMQDDKPFFSQLKIPMPQVREPIGTGDAFAAGMLFGLMNNYTPQRTANFAVACGVLKQSVPGDWALISLQEINAMLEDGIKSRVAR